MNNAEAKFILQGYRPNGSDAGDATFCAAVEQTKTDPALGEWFAKQQAFDAAISDKFNQVMPPADLRAAILAGGRVTTAGLTSRSWWNRPAWMAAAAAVAVIFATSLSLWPRQAEAFDEFAYQDAGLGAIHGHGDRGKTTNALQWALSQPGMKLGNKLPAEFADLKSGGCRTINYRGHQVLEVCFNRNGAWFHCYIARVTDFPNLALSAKPVLEDKGAGCVASWSDSQNLIVVVSRDGRKNLEALL